MLPRFSPLETECTTSCRRAASAAADTPPEIVLWFQPEFSTDTDVRRAVLPIAAVRDSGCVIPGFVIPANSASVLNSIDPALQPDHRQRVSVHFVAQNQIRVDSWLRWWLRCNRETYRGFPRGR